MPSIYDIKPTFQLLLKPCMRKLAHYGIIPNQVTCAALFLSLTGGVLIWYSKAEALLLLIIPILLLFRMAMNALDGMLAREYNQSSRMGEILNEVGDILSDTFLYLPMIRLFYDSMNTVMLLALFIVLAGLTEFCGILVKSMTRVRRYDGPMGKSDRAFFSSILVLALYICPAFVHQSSTMIFLILDSLLMVSCIHRLRYSFVTQKGSEHE